MDSSVPAEYGNNLRNENGEENKQQQDRIKLWFNKIPLNANEEEFGEYLKRYGDIGSFFIMREVDGKSRGMAKAIFRGVTDVERLISTLKDAPFQGQELTVEISKSSNPRFRDNREGGSRNYETRNREVYDQYDRNRDRYREREHSYYGGDRDSYPPSSREREREMYPDHYHREYPQESHSRERYYREDPYVNRDRYEERYYHSRPPPEPQSREYYSRSERRPSPPRYGYQ